MKKISLGFMGLAYFIFVPAARAADKCYDSSGKLQDYCKLDKAETLGFVDQSFTTVATNIVNILGIIAGVLSVLFLIIGGISYITSEGDPAKKKKKKSTVLYAVIGLAVSILAPLIVGYVLEFSPK